MGYRKIYITMEWLQALQKFRRFHLKKPTNTKGNFYYFPPTSTDEEETDASSSIRNDILRNSCLFLQTS